jgi:hypothetical protein
MLMSMIQIIPLENGARGRGGSFKLTTESMRTIESLVAQLITVWVHGAFRIPR